MVHTKKVPYSYQGRIAIAWKPCYGETFGRSINLEYLFPSRKPDKLPMAIARKEVLKITEKANNIKHKGMMAVVYSAGLMVGELISLKIKDIDSSRMVIHIKSGKGNKDRIVPLSEKTLSMLREHYKKYAPKQYLFFGRELSAGLSPDVFYN